jgi:chromosome segregation ATPase
MIQIALMRPLLIEGGLPTNHDGNTGKAMVDIFGTEVRPQGEEPEAQAGKKSMLQSVSKEVEYARQEIQSVQAKATPGDGDSPDSMEETNQKLPTKSQQLQEAYNKMRERAMILENQNTRLQENIDRLLLEIEIRGKTLQASLEKEVKQRVLTDTLRAECAKLQYDIENRNDCIRQRDQEIRELRAKIQELCIEKTNVEQRCRSNSQRYAELAGELSKQGECIENLRRLNSVLIGQIRKLSDMQAAFEASGEEQMRKIRDLMQSTVTNALKYTEVANERDGLKTENAELKETVKNNIEEIAAIRRALSERQDAPPKHPVDGPAQPSVANHADEDEAA